MKTGKATHGKPNKNADKEYLLEQFFELLHLFEERKKLDSHDF